MLCDGTPADPFLKAANPLPVQLLDEPILPDEKKISYSYLFDMEIFMIPFKYPKYTLRAPFFLIPYKH